MNCNSGDLHSFEHSHGKHLTLQHQHEEDIDHLATNCNCGISRVRRTVWTMGNGLCVVAGKYHETVLRIRTGHDVEYLGPGDNRREHKTRSIVTSKTNLAHATARNDDERATVLLVHTGHDAEHLGPANRRENSMKSIARAPDNEERQRNPCSQRRIRTPRGAFFFLLFFLVLSGAEKAEERAAFSFSFSFLLSSSNNVFILRQCSRRNWRWCRQCCRHQPSTLPLEEAPWAATYPSVTAHPGGSGSGGRPGPLPREWRLLCPWADVLLALALVWPLEAWCVNSARAIATLCCSCSSHERKRRCLRRRAAPSPAARDKRKRSHHRCGRP